MNSAKNLIGFFALSLLLMIAFVTTSCARTDSDYDNSIDIDEDVECNDGVNCTVDSYGGVLGCLNVPDDRLCNDGDPSTVDACTATGCIFTPIAVCPCADLYAAAVAEWTGTGFLTDGWDTCQGGTSISIVSRDAAPVSPDLTFIRLVANKASSAPDTPSCDASVAMDGFFFVNDAIENIQPAEAEECAALQLSICAPEL